jgi:hypothetical protein
MEMMMLRTKVRIPYEKRSSKKNKSTHDDLLHSNNDDHESEDSNE